MELVVDVQSREEGLRLLAAAAAFSVQVNSARLGGQLVLPDDIPADIEEILDAAVVEPYGVSVMELELAQQHSAAAAEIDRLALYLMEHCPEQITDGLSAVDVAIRLLDGAAGVGYSSEELAAKQAMWASQPEPVIEPEAGAELLNPFTEADE